MPPVSPGQPSSFGSVFADSPGLLRENGFTTQFNIAATTAQMFAVCSGEASTDVTQFQPVIAPLGPGDSLNIFGVQGICASNGDPLMFAIKTGSKADDAIGMVHGSNISSYLSKLMDQRLEQKTYTLK